MYILSEIYFSLYFIILDQYLLILFVNINIFYLLKEHLIKATEMYKLLHECRVLLYRTYILQFLWFWKHYLIGLIT